MLARYRQKDTLPVVLPYVQSKSMFLLCAFNLHYLLKLVIVFLYLSDFSLFPNLCLDVLVEYLSAAPEARDYRRKDGALVAIAVLAKVRISCDMGGVRMCCVRIRMSGTLSMITISFRRFPIKSRVTSIICVTRRECALYSPMRKCLYF